ncbi:MAG: transposase [Spirochaetales bacterium]|nr:transposase [Spirochaetales bacterium]
MARIPIEGVFGVGKRRYGMARIMTKLRETSKTAISMTVLVMNLDKTLRDLLLSFVSSLKKPCFLSKTDALGLKLWFAELFSKP